MSSVATGMVVLSGTMHVFVDFNFRCVRVLATIFTARKRSLGQDNVFTGVCLSAGGLPISPHWMQTPP